MRTRRLAVLFALSVAACEEASPAPDDKDPELDASMVEPELDATTHIDARVRDARSDDAEPAPRDAALDASDIVARVRVTAPAGSLEGKLEGKTRAFLGIPYGQAPTGALRFTPPRALAPWTGVRSAQTFGPICPQVTPDKRFPGVLELPQDEDCLSLNVYAPERAQAAPVMLFIHGGSGVSGSGSDYDGHYLSEAGDVVVVTINYRLGPLAWLAHPALDAALDTTSGNMGLRDQQLALRWVRDNIAAFGGDANNVTVFGQSAGSSNICLHLFAKGSEQLAAHYVMESGGCVSSAVGPQTADGVHAVSADLITALCNEAEDTVQCLRERSADELVAWKSTRGSLQELMGPYIDGELLTDHPLALLRAGKFARAPVIAGSNRYEANFLASPFWGAKWPMVNNGIELIIGLSAMYPSTWTDILAHYGLPLSDAEANVLMTRIIDDSWFRCAARRLARELSERGVPAYLYSFEVAPAVHTQELEYVFGWPESRASQLYPAAPKQPLVGLQTAMQAYWSNFAHSGDPNEPGLPPWPRYTRDSDTHAVLKDPVATGSKLAEADCDFWDDILTPP